MGAPLSYQLDGGVATIAMDDGKANALSPEMLASLDAALDQAERDGAVVLLHGRDGMFSAGFDLRVLGGGGEAAVQMLRAGFELSYRMLSFPRPIVVACTGHAIAMGAFLLLSADHRIGISGGGDGEVGGVGHRIVVNEVAIGLTLPRAAVEICRQRLAPAHFTRAVTLAEEHTPEQAVVAGFLDEVVPAAELHRTASAVAGRLATLDPTAHAATKRRAAEPALTALRAAIEADDRDLAAL